MAVGDCGLSDSLPATNPQLSTACFTGLFKLLSAKICLPPLLASGFFFVHSIVQLCCATQIYATSGAAISMLAIPTSSQTEISGSIENNNGQIRIVLSNQGKVEFTGMLRMSLGSDIEQRDIGQADFKIAALEMRILKPAGVSSSGTHYTLTIYDSRGKLTFHKFAPIPKVSDTSPDIAITLVPSSTKGRAIAGTPGVSSKQESKAAIEQGSQAEPSPEEVQVVARLLAGDGDKESFMLSFELASKYPVNNAEISIYIRKYKDSKPVSINTNSLVEFKLPEQINRETQDSIDYKLISKEGRLLARGTLTISELMTDDFVSVLEIIPGREEYEPGEAAKVTVFMEGSSPSGYRLEVLIKDRNGVILLKDQRQVSKIDQTQILEEFQFAIPDNARSPLTVVFKVFNPASGLMFDSGEREISLKEK